MRRFFLAWLTFVATAFAGEPKVSEIFYLPDVRDISPYVEKKRVDLSVHGFANGPVWDMREAAGAFGLEPTAGDIFLWAPMEHRLFVHTSEANLSLLDSLLTPEFGRNWIDVDFKLLRKDKAGKTATAYRWQARTKFGIIYKSLFSAEDQGISQTSLEFEPFVQPNGTDLELTLALILKSSTQTFEVTGRFDFQDGKEEVVWKSEDQASATTYELSVLPTIVMEAPPSPRERPSAEKDATIKSIEAKLKVQ